jgi:phytoene synthase
MTTQLRRYYSWQEHAEKGFSLIPKRYLISVKTASEMYNWTAEQIIKNPYIVYDVKVKPMLNKILTTVLINIIDPMKPKKKDKNYLNLKPLPQIN